ncbi:MAG: DUF2889 domain-containing protein [bacterium]|nr:DUF2889 domain-containing protein [bacterium]
MPKDDIQPELIRNRHGSGAFRRRLRMIAPDDRTVVVGLEDDMHHYEAALTHDGTRITGANAAGPRMPWDPCAGALDQLQLLVGCPLTIAASEVFAWTDVRQQCTHLYDAAVLGVLHAARGKTGIRQYDATVPDWYQPPFDAWIMRDGVEVLRWRMAARLEIESPEPFSGRAIKGGFVRWCEQALGPEEAEAAWVLQRTTWLSGARLSELEDCDDAIESGLVPDVCWTSQPERYHVAFRRRGTLRDHGPSADGMLVDMPTRWPQLRDT